MRDAATLAMLADTSDLDDLLRSQLKGLRPVSLQMVVVLDGDGDRFYRKKKEAQEGGRGLPPPLSS